VSARDLQNLLRRAFGGLVLLCLGRAAVAQAQGLPVMVGQSYDTAVAALKSKGIAYKEAVGGTGKTLTYASGAESVTLDFTLWPKDLAAPASAWEAAGPEGKQLTLTHILDAAPGSDARRSWVRSFEKDDRHWAYLPATADAARPAAERSKYPVAALLQLAKPPATLLFEAARAAGTPPGTEMTALDITLENPHKPRRF
jgi:hypothetical protein